MRRIAYVGGGANRPDVRDVEMLRERKVHPSVGLVLRRPLRTGPGDQFPPS